MKTDYFGNPLFQEQDIFNMFYKGQLEYLDQILVEETPNILKLFNELNIKPKQLDLYENQDFFDEANQSIWFITDEYKNFPLVEWCMINA